MLEGLGQQNVEISAKRVILELLNASGERAIPVRAMVRGASVLGVQESSLRVALARLKSQGLVSSPQRGMYRIGAQARPLQEHIARWRSLGVLAAPWGGDWVGCALGREVSPKAQRLLWLLGFRPLHAHLRLRPHNLRGGLDAMRATAAKLGLSADLPMFRLDSLSSFDEARARCLWDPEKLSEAYHRALRDLERAESTLERANLEQAAREAFVAGTFVVRLLAVDPILPGELVDVEARAQLVEAMGRFDERGRRLWEELLSQSFEVMPAHASVKLTQGTLERAS